MQPWCVAVVSAATVCQVLKRKLDSTAAVYGAPSSAPPLRESDVVLERRLQQLVRRTAGMNLEPENEHQNETEDEELNPSPTRP